MRLFSPFMHATLAVMVSMAAAQLPPQRLQIPGAVLVGQAKPVPFRTRAHFAQDSSPGPTLRQRGRPIPNAIPLPPPSQALIRPVVEEAEEAPASTPQPSTFDDEVNKLGLSVLTSAVRQAVDLEEDLPNTPPPRQLAFRPERPVPVTRENVRDNTVVLQRPSVFRQEQRERQEQRQEARERQEQRQEARERQEQRENIPRPLLRQEPAPQRQRQYVPQPAPVPVARQPPHPLPRYHAASEYEDDGPRGGRTRRPPIQILRKYRTDNPDGSITWGYENEDGSFKEETLGTDCMVRGKYGYIDPEGTKREYSYEAGNKCDLPGELEDEAVLQGKPQPQPQPRRPQPRPAYAAQPQY